MLLGEEGSSVLEPSGGVAGGTEAEIADSVTHWSSGREWRVQVLSFGCGCGNAENGRSCIAERTEKRKTEENRGKHGFCKREEEGVLTLWHLLKILK